MFQPATDPTIVIFPFLMGCLAIFLALSGRRLLRFLGLKPKSEVFTIPRLQRSAKMTEDLVRLFLLVAGAGFLIQGVGPTFLSGDVVRGVTTVSVVLSVLIVFWVLGVNLLAMRKKDDEGQN